MILDYYADNIEDNILNRELIDTSFELQGHYFKICITCGVLSIQEQTTRIENCGDYYGHICKRCAKNIEQKNNKDNELKTTNNYKTKESKDLNKFKLCFVDDGMDALRVEHCGDHTNDLVFTTDRNGCEINLDDLDTLIMRLSNYLKAALGEDD